VFWEAYNYVAVVAIVTQALFLLQMCRNYRYALKKAVLKHSGYQPAALLTVPCKGIDSAFEKNISSFFALDYDNYFLNFVVEDIDDPAYEKLCRLKEELAAGSQARSVEVLVAGYAAGCSQKIHNLLCSCLQAGDDIEVFAFADSDACVKPGWLSHLVFPLHRAKQGAATGYRWFVPQKNNLASLALSAINAKIAQLLGDTRFNQAWGGSMAIRKETFYETGLDKIWPTAISDDLSLSYAVKKAGKKVIFVPGCLVASYEQMNWRQLAEFARRQFLITRVTTPGAWWFGLFSSVYSLAGLWAGAAVALYAASAGKEDLGLYTAVPIVFFVGQICRSILRQKMIVKLLAEDAPKMKAAIVADIVGNCIWSWLLLGCIVASAFGRTITWRQVRYTIGSQKP